MIFDGRKFDGVKVGGSLDRAVARTMIALAEAVNPEFPAVPPEAVVAFTEEMVAQMARGFALLFPIGVRGFELATLVTHGRLFSRLTVEQRRDVAEAWIHSRIAIRRELMRALKGLCLITYYSDPRVHEHLGYRPDAHIELVSAERLKRHAV